MLSEIRRPQKVFTLDEANRTLPLVSRILKDIVRCGGEINGLEKEISGSEDATSEVLVCRRQGKIVEIKGYLAELRNVGCECKDLRTGLVDFPASLEGRIVYLCWKLDEPEISHWHEVEAGFGGRQPVRRSDWDHEALAE